MIRLTYNRTKNMFFAKSEETADHALLREAKFRQSRSGPGGWWYTDSVVIAHSLMRSHPEAVKAAFPANERVRTAEEKLPGTQQGQLEVADFGRCHYFALFEIFRRVDLKNPGTKKKAMVVIQSAYENDKALWSAFCHAYRKHHAPLAPDAAAPDAVAAPDEDIEKRLDAKEDKDNAEGHYNLLQERIDLLQEQLQELERPEYHPPELHVRIGKSKPKTIKGVLPAFFQRMLQLAQCRINIMLVGPAGCGKSFIVEKLAEALGLRYGAQSCSAGMSESAFQGYLLPIGTKGQFVYVQSVFMDLYENGGVFLIDEGDAADENLMVFINQALANDHFFNPLRHDNPRVNKHADFVCVMAANTFGTGADAVYVGRNQLDEATLDRFRAGRIEVDYSAEVEEAFVHPAVLAWGRRVRTAIQRHKLRRLMSTRVMLDYTKATEAHGWDESDWEQSYFADWSAEERGYIQ